MFGWWKNAEKFKRYVSFFSFFFGGSLVRLLAEFYFFDFILCFLHFIFSQKQL